MDKKEYLREYQRTHKAEMRAYRAKWREKNRQKIRDYHRVMYATNPEFRKKKAEYEKSRKDHKNDRVREQRKKNPEKFHAYSRKWAAEHREYYRQKGVETVRREREMVIAAYGGKCECCGLDIPEFLTIDHPNGRESSGHPKKMTGWRLYAWLRKNGYPKDGFRCLCFNCNCVRGYLGYCPHEKMKEAVA